MLYRYLAEASQVIFVGMTVLADDYAGLLHGMRLGEPKAVTAKLYGDEGVPTCLHIDQSM
jgi:hypothetical protein